MDDGGSINNLISSTQIENEANHESDTHDNQWYDGQPNHQLLIDGEPIHINGRSPELERSPAFGEHSSQVLRTVLGLSDGEIAELVVSGAVS